MHKALIAFCLVVTVSPASAQIKENHGIEAAQGCAAGIDYERESYHIGDVTITTPFDLLHLRYLSHLKEERLSGLPVRKNSLFRTDDLNRAVEHLRETELAPPPIGLPISGSLLLVYAKNCRMDEGRKYVDLEFWYMPARVPSFWSHSFESYWSETRDPAKPAGIAPRKFSISPQLGYSASTRLFGGAQLNSESHEGWLQKLHAEGESSARYHRAEAFLSGSLQPSASWMERSDWKLSYQHREEPVAARRFRAAQLAAVWKGYSRPMGSAGWVFRYGTGLGAGYRQADEIADSPLPSGVVSSISLGSLKLFAGATVRTGHQSFASSYGLLLGHTGKGGTIDFRKHLVDVAYSWRRVRNHRPLEVDTRFTAGFIENTCRPGSACGMPLAERFFGGNIESNFLDDDSWVIRSQPLLRGVPRNGLNGGAAGGYGGGDRFWALNLTVGYSLFRITLIPRDLLANKEVIDRMDATPKTAEALLASAYASMDKEFVNDPGLEKAREVLDPLRKDLDEIRTSWDKLADEIPEESEEEYQICTEDHLDALPLDIEDVEARKISIYLLGNRTGNLARTIACLKQFAKAPGDEMNADAAQLESHRGHIEAIVESTETYRRAAAKAAVDLALGKRTIHTLFHEVNLFSISPVFVFDAGRIRSALSRAPAQRYSLGGGLRLTLASTVRFTAGYAVNANRQLNEGRGALFATLDILDIFR